MSGGVTGSLWLAGVPVVGLDDVPGAIAQRLQRRLGAADGPAQPAANVILRGLVGGQAQQVIRVGRRDAEWSDGELRLFPGPGEVRIRSSAEGYVEIECGPRVRDLGVPAALAQLALLEHNITPLHAATFEHDGRLIAAAGWTRGGKTAALMAMLDRGAQPKGAEWVYLWPDGRVMAGDHALRVRWTHLGDSKAARGLVSSTDAARMRLAGGAGAALERGSEAARAVPVAGHALGGAMRRLGAAVEGRSYVDAPLPGASAQSGETLATVLVVARSTAGYSAQRLAPADLVERLAAALEEEFRSLTVAETRFRFASGQRPTWSPDWPARYRAALELRLAGADGWLVLHPDHSSSTRLAETITQALP